MINILIVHYNTPELTECLVKSINKFSPDCHIYIFDNSDKLPFEYKQPNITIFDNTCGQIIDFNEWLKQFPNKGGESKDANGRCISARHCITIDKCFDLIDDNFILLDSDILLKRDISELYDDRYIFCSQLEANKQGIERVLPYCCFINVNKCKSLGIRFFDKNLMHGINYHSIANRYDTGASFYKHTSKYEYKLIELDDYIVHYKGASWSPKRSQNAVCHQNLSVDEWLDNYKDLYDTEEVKYKNSKVIYTCITGGYEALVNPTYINLSYDYVCFTDNDSIKSNIWQIRPIPEELKKLPTVKQQRILKICPHKYLSEYDLSIWIDGSVDILKDPDEFIDYELDDEKSVYIPRHPQRDCIYEEAAACEKLKKDTTSNISVQVNRYRSENFPSHFGLAQTNIVIRKHNDPYCIKLMDMWSNEMLNNPSHRDQLSFNYCLWKLGNKGFKYLDKKTCRSEYFWWYKHNQRKSSTSALAIDTFYLPNLEIDKKVIYTVALNSKPAELSYKDPNYDYVCFTNQDITSDTWQIRPIPEELSELNDRKKKAILKICPHEYLKEYDLSIYVDNAKMIKDVDKFELNTKSSVYMYSRGIHCAYKEAINCIINKEDKADIIRSQMSRYQFEKYPKFYGLANTTLIIRLHNTPYCVELMNKWKNEVMKWSNADQLSFNYCLWKTGNEGFSYIK